MLALILCIGCSLVAMFFTYLIRINVGGGFTFAFCVFWWFMALLSFLLIFV